MKERDEREIENESKRARGQKRGGRRRMVRDEEQEETGVASQAEKLSVSIKDLLCQISMRGLL